MRVKNDGNRYGAVARTAYRQLREEFMRDARELQAFRGNPSEMEYAVRRARHFNWLIVRNLRG
jgi:hypothetical protein